MIRGSDVRQAAHPIDTLFLDRWSPRAMTGEPIDEAELLDLLEEGNRTWCHKASALIVFISRTTHDQTGRTLVTHSYDTGAAWMSFALQGWLRGLVVHGMAGFDYARARTTLHVPDDMTVEAMAAVGRPGPKEDLPPQHLQRESPSPRRPIEELLFAGPYRG